MDFQLTEEQKLLRDTVRAAVDQEIAPRAEHHDRTGEVPWANLKLMARLGLYGVAIPEEYGGQGGDIVSTCILTEELSRGCRSTAAIRQVTWAVAQFLLFAASEEEKRKYIPPLASGYHQAAYAWTEPSAGSDRAAVETTAVDDGDTWVINGLKTYISNSGISAFYIIVAKTDPAAGLGGLSTFLLEPDTPGFTIPSYYQKMGTVAYPCAQLQFTDCRVPKSALIGGLGQGYWSSVQLIDRLRPPLAMQAVGVAQAALEASLRYANERVQFGQPIGKFQAVQQMLADMAMDVEASRLLVYQAARLTDVGLPSRKQAIMAKVFASEAGNRVCYKATQIFGGYGFMKGCPVERYYRDIRHLTIAEGASEIQRSHLAELMLAEI